jgi:tRNA (guanine10-N2)-methyltransferase
MRCCVPVTNGAFVSRDDYSEEKLPMHPCFQLVANSEQVLTTYTSRRLLTLEKLQEPKVQYSLISDLYSLFCLFV